MYVMSAIQLMDYRSGSTARDHGRAIATHSFFGRALLIALLVICSSSGTSAQEQKLSKNECSKLALLAATEGPSNPLIRVSEMDFSKYDRMFVYFYAYLDSAAPTQASPRIGAFAVNPWTGEVFNTDSCRRIETPKLQSAQRELRKRFRKSNLKYAHLKPLC